MGDNYEINGIIFAGDLNSTAKCLQNKTNKMLGFDVESMFLYTVKQH